MKSLWRVCFSKCLTFFIVVLIISFLPACRNKNAEYGRNVVPAKIQDIKIHRFEKVLFEIDPGELKERINQLKPRYPVFLAADFDDTTVMNTMTEFVTGKFSRDLYNEILKKYPDLRLTEKELTLAFARYKAQFPEATIPRVSTYISGIDFKFPVQLIDTNLIIALDDYLGFDFKPYRSLGIPLYRIEKMKPDYLTRDCAMMLAMRHIDPSKAGNTLIDKMILEGKKLYFIDLLFPDMTDSLKIGFQASQNEWVVENQKELWAFMVENKLFYTTDPEAISKLLSDGPYTAYFGQESPPRLGQWLGWQIVREYMKSNPEITAEQMLNDYNHAGIFTRSGFKPGR